MVIYQKQPRVAYRQYCTRLQQHRLTLVPPPSQNAFFPSSCLSCVNIHYGRKTAFSSAWSGINFRSFCFQREEQERRGMEGEAEDRGLLYFWVKILSWFSPFCSGSTWSTRKGSGRHQLTFRKLWCPPTATSLPQLLESTVGIWVFVLPNYRSREESFPWTLTSYQPPDILKSLVAESPVNPSCSPTPNTPTQVKTQKCVEVPSQPVYKSDWEEQLWEGHVSMLRAPLLDPKGSPLWGFCLESYWKIFQ